MVSGRAPAPYNTVINTFTWPYGPAARPNWTTDDAPRITQSHMATHRDGHKRVHSDSAHDRHVQLEQYIKIEPKITLTLSKINWQLQK